VVLVDEKDDTEDEDAGDSKDGLRGRMISVECNVPVDDGSPE
jgi:hypothetical protein